MVLRVTVYAQGVNYGNALQAASNEGHKEIVQLLLERGADVNAKGGLYGNALQAASSNGHKEIVQLLLERGADVNAVGSQGDYGNALQAASSNGHKEIVQLLLERGADINAQGGLYGNALIAASNEGHKEIFWLLLERRANMHAPGVRHYEMLPTPSHLLTSPVSCPTHAHADTNSASEHKENKAPSESAAPWPSKSLYKILQLLLVTLTEVWFSWVLMQCN